MTQSKPSDKKTDTARSDINPLETKQFSPQTLADLVQAAEARRQSEKAPPPPSRQGVLRFEVIETHYPITRDIKDDLLIGRPDPVSGVNPDIDLTQLAGYRMGVSRQHARIEWNHDDNLLYVFDLGSSNGTFINGNRLPPYQGHAIYNGDEVRFGQLAMHSYYEIKSPDNTNLIPFRSDGLA